MSLKHTEMFCTGPLRENADNYLRENYSQWYRIKFNSGIIKLINIWMHSAAHDSLRVNMNRACFHESEIKILIEKYPTMLNNLTVIMGPHSIGI